MKVSNLDREQTMELIGTYRKRVEFNNRLNAFARQYMKDRGLDNWHRFNGYHDEPTQDMRDTMAGILNNGTLGDTSWMDGDLKLLYMEYTGAVFAGLYGPHVNEYVRRDLHDLEAHLQEIEVAADSRDEENRMFRVERNLGTNRMNLFFGGRPDDAIIAMLRRNGFRYSPYLGAWTRQLTANAEASLARLKSEMGV